MARKRPPAFIATQPGTRGVTGIVCNPRGHLHPIKGGRGLFAIVISS